MVEIKDGYAGFLGSDWGKAFVARIFMKQAMDQVQAAGGRPLRWYFSQKAVADYARQIFSEKRELKNIEIKYESWPRRTE
jgi:hypothetical protein